MGAAMMVCKAGTKGTLRKAYCLALINSVSSWPFTIMYALDAAAHGIAPANLSQDADTVRLFLEHRQLLADDALGNGAIKQLVAQGRAQGKKQQRIDNPTFAFGHGSVRGQGTGDWGQSDGGSRTSREPTARRLRPP